MEPISKLFLDLASDLEQLSNLYREYTRICLDSAGFNFEPFQLLNENTNKDLQNLKKQISDYTFDVTNKVTKLIQVLKTNYIFPDKEVVITNKAMLTLVESLYYVNSKYNALQDFQVEKSLQELHSVLIDTTTTLHNKINEYNAKHPDKTPIYNLKIAKKHAIKEMRSRRDYLMEDIEACQAKLKKQGW